MLECLTHNCKVAVRCSPGHLQATWNKLARVNSASYPQRDGKWVLASKLRGEYVVWLIGMSALCMQYHQYQVLLGSLVDRHFPFRTVYMKFLHATAGHDLYNALLIISLCQTAAISRDYKGLLVTTLDSCRVKPKFHYADFPKTSPSGDVSGKSA